MFCLKVISTCNLLSFPFHMSSTFHLIYSANCKFKAWKLRKLLMEVYQCINMIIMVIQFPRVTLCFAWKLFQLAIYSHSLFICPQLFILFKVNCKFKVRKLVKAMNGSVSMDLHDNFDHPISKCNTMFCLKVISTCNLLSFPISYVLNFSSYSK